MRARLHSLGLTPQLAAIGLGGGLLSGLLGVGGGIVMVPLLVLWAAYSQRDAHAISLGAIIPISIAGIATYGAAGEVRYGTAIALAAGIDRRRADRRGLARADRRAPAQDRVRHLPRRRRRPGRNPRMSGPTLYVVLVAFGVVVGIGSGLLGVGGGTLIVPFLTLAVGFTQHAAEATSLLVILPTAIVGSLVLRRRGVGDLPLALRFGVVGAVGSVLGALLALALPADTLRLVFAVFVGLVGLRLARDGIRGDPHSPES